MKKQLTVLSLFDGISDGMEREIFKARRLGLEEICLN